MSVPPALCRQARADAHRPERGYCAGAVPTRIRFPAMSVRFFNDQPARFRSIPMGRNRRQDDPALMTRRGGQRVPPVLKIRSEPAGTARSAADKYAAVIAYRSGNTQRIGDYSCRTFRAEHLLPDRNRMRLLSKFRTVHYFDTSAVEYFNMFDLSI